MNNTKCNTHEEFVLHVLSARECVNNFMTGICLTWSICSVEIKHHIWCIGNTVTVVKPLLIFFLTHCIRPYRTRRWHLASYNDHWTRTTLTTATLFSTVQWCSHEGQLRALMACGLNIGLSGICWHVVTIHVSAVGLERPITSKIKLAIKLKT